MTTGEDIRRMMAVLLRKDRALPEALDVEDVEPLPESERPRVVTLLQGLAYLRGLANRRGRRPQR